MHEAQVLGPEPADDPVHDLPQAVHVRIVEENLRHGEHRAVRGVAGGSGFDAQAEPRAILFGQHDGPADRAAQFGGPKTARSRSKTVLIPIFQSWTTDLQPTAETSCAWATQSITW